jgi:hypothetical protein
VNAYVGSLVFWADVTVGLCTTRSLTRQMFWRPSRPPNILTKFEIQTGLDQSLFDQDHRRAGLTRDLGRPVRRHIGAREEGGMLRWALNTGCLTLLMGAVQTGAAADRLSRLVVIEELSFPMDVEPPLLDLRVNHDQGQGHKRLQTV